MCYRGLGQPHLGFRQREGPARPCVRTAVSPARVRSRISSRSNSASAAKMPNTRRPAAVVVSIYAPCPVSTRKAHAASQQVLHGVDQVGDGTAEAVEPPDDEHIHRPAGAAPVDVDDVDVVQQAVEYRGGEDLVASEDLGPVADVLVRGRRGTH